MKLNQSHARLEPIGRILTNRVEGCWPRCPDFHMERKLGIRLQTDDEADAWTGQLLKPAVLGGAELEAQNSAELQIPYVCHCCCA